MKIKSSLKKMCRNCRIIKRYGKLLITCTNLKHKRKQG